LILPPPEPAVTVIQSNPAPAVETAAIPPPLVAPPAPLPPDPGRLPSAPPSAFEHVDPRRPKVELGFRDGTSVQLDESSSVSRALRDAAARILSD
jgi:hypothetical protein